MKKRQLLVIMLASVIGGLVAVFAYSAILDKKEKNIVSAVKGTHQYGKPESRT